MADALIVCGFFHFAAAMLLFGAGTFLGLLAPPALAVPLARQMRPMTIALGLVLGATALLWLGLETAEAGTGWGDAINPAVIGLVLRSTAFGQVWVLRLAFIVLLLGTLLLQPQRNKAVALLAGLALGSLGLIGHATMEEGVWGWTLPVNQVLHLLAGGFWIGCLPPLLISLARLKDPELGPAAATALRRFSGLGHFAVALVIATGIVNTMLILGKPPLDLSSPYQTLLALKIGLVGLMVAIASCNRYLFVPRLAGERARALRLIGAGAICEIIIGTLVVALVSTFATFDPV